MRARSVMLPAAAGVVMAMAGLLAAGTAAAGIETIPDRLEEGESAAILITDEAGAPLKDVEVEAVYRPGSEVSRVESLGPTGVDGMITWTPGTAGLVSLRTVGEPALNRNLTVRYRGLPILGLLILVAAGIILYGNVIMGFRRLGALPPQLPPDT